MNAIQLKVNEANLVNNLAYAFTNTKTVLSELMQNARRAGATTVQFDYEDDCLIVVDNGKGIDDMQTLLTVAESGWDKDVKTVDRPFGMGFQSCLHAAERVTVESKGKKASFVSKEALQFASIPVIGSDFIGGTCIRLHGLKMTEPEIAYALVEFSRGFPIPVVWKGQTLERENAIDEGKFVQTSVGLVKIAGIHFDPEANPSLEFKGYLQGIEVYRSYSYHRATASIVHLDSTLFSARMPDRDKLIDQEKAVAQVTTAIQEVIRSEMAAVRQQLGDQVFIERYWHALVNTRLTDVINDIPMLPAHMLAQSAFPMIEEFPSFDQVKVSVRRDQVESGEVVLYTGSVSDESAAVHMLAYKLGWLRVGNLPGGHWANPHIIDAEEIAENVVVETIEEDPVTQNFRGWFFAKVRHCKSIRITLDQHSVTFDDDALYYASDLLVPNTDAANAAHAVQQGSSYVSDDVFDEGCRDEDYASLMALINLHRTNDVAALLKSVLQSSEMHRYPQLNGNHFVVSINEDGGLSVKLQPKPANRSKKRTKA